jgi:hypothetical protein
MNCLQVRNTSTQNFCINDKKVFNEPVGMGNNIGTFTKVFRQSINTDSLNNCVKYTTSSMTFSIFFVVKNFMTNLSRRRRRILVPKVNNTLRTMYMKRPRTICRVLLKFFLPYYIGMIPEDQQV